MTSFQVKGTLTYVGQVEPKGVFKSRKIRLKTAGEYPQTVEFEIASNKIEVFNGKVGETIEVDFNLKGREWTSPEGETKIFNKLEVWKWNIESKLATPQPPIADDFNTNDDLPF